jgi:hypothetical protein
VILPNKHLPPRKSLVGIGAQLLTSLNRPLTVSALWTRVRQDPDIGNFQRFVLALDLLYAMDALELRDGMLCRRRS